MALCVRVIQYSGKLNTGLDLIGLDHEMLLLFTNSIFFTLTSLVEAEKVITV